MPGFHERPVSFAMPKQQLPITQKAQQNQAVPPPNLSSSSSSAAFNRSPAAKAVRIPAWAKSGGPAAMGPPMGPKKDAASSVMGAPTGPKKDAAASITGAPAGPKSTKRRASHL